MVDDNDKLQRYSCDPKGRPTTYPLLVADDEYAEL